MNISHISVSNLPVLYRFGGAIERRIVEIAQQQVARGHQVRVFSIGEETEVREVNGVEFHFLKCRTRLPYRHLEFQHKVVRKLRSNSGDVLHFHSQPEGAWMSRKVNARKILSYDFFDFRGGNRTPLYHIYKRILRRFDLLLPCSDFCLRESSRFWEFPDGKVKILFNGVNTQQFRPDPEAAAAERRQLGLAGRVILYVGRVCRQKGSDVLLEAMSLLNQRRRDLKLVIAGPIAQFGTTADPDRWVERIEKVGGLYLGAVEESRLSAIYNLADVFVMPTRAVEMFGMAAIEAQACGKPVVASDCGGLPEVVPLDCGGRFPVGNADRLAEELARILDDDDCRRRCGENAIQNAARFDWSRICDTLDGLYRS